MKAFLPKVLALLLPAALLLHAPVLFGGGVRLALDRRMFPPWSACAGPEDRVPDPATGWYNRLSTDSNFWYSGQMQTTVRQLRSGSFPAWDDKTLFGTPLAAQNGTPPWYPPFLLLLCGEPHYMLGWLACLHMVLAGYLMARLLRWLRARPGPLLLGALAFALGPWMAYRLNNPTLLAASAWAPLALEGALRVGRDRRPGLFAALLAGALAMLFLAGMPQYALLTGLGAAGLGLWNTRLAEDRRGARVLLLLLGGTAALGLAAPGLFPTVRLYLESIRSAEPGLGSTLALEPPALVGLVLPDFFGGAADLAGWARYQDFPTYRALLTPHPQNNPLENGLYLGAPLLVLALVGLRRDARGAAGSRPGALPFLVMALAALLLAMRAIPPQALYSLPGLGPDEPRRVLLLFHLGMICAATISLSRWAETPRGGGGRGLAWLLLFLPFAGLLLAGWLWPGLGRAGFRLLCPFLEGTEASRLLSFQVGAAFLPLLSLGLTGLLLWVQGRRPRPAQAGLIALAALELLVFGLRTNPAPARTQLAADGRSRTLAFLRARREEAGPGGPSRLMHVRCFHALQGNILAGRGIPAVTVTHPLPPAGSVAFLRLVEEGVLDPLLPRGISPLQEPASAAHPLLARAGVGLFCCRDLATARGLEAAGLELLFPRQGSGEEVAIYGSPRAQPTVRVLYRWRRAGSAREVAAMLREDPSPPVLEGEGLPPPPPTPGRHRLAWVRRRPGRLEFDVDLTGSPGLLYLAHCVHPGWRAQVDGVERTILKADLTFMALPLSPGRHRVLLSYQGADRHLIYLAFTLGLVLLAILFLPALSRGRGH